MSALDLNWRLVTDQVMGGVSNGEVQQTQIDSIMAHLLTGRVSLENNGGFVQMATDLAPPSVSTKGIALMLRGNGEEYNIHLRTSNLDRPWQSYRQSFTAPNKWTKCHFEFAGFKPHRTDNLFRPAEIKRIGIVAIGRVFDAEVAVGSVEWY